MQKKENTKIAYIGGFSRLHDEEYIARSFEMNGCTVVRIPQVTSWFDLKQVLERELPDILLYGKWECPKELFPTILKLKRTGMKTVCWIFDLYFDYTREYQVRNKAFFKSDFVFTTDGGHGPKWTQYGIKHQCLRQGIYDKECYLVPFKEPKYDVVFVGSDNPIYQERKERLRHISSYCNFKWFGKRDTNEVRGTALNELFAESKVVVGDSYYSPHYWSNRVVETLGRGGFLIHQDVPGLKEEYPDLVTYKKGDLQDLRSKIEYYLSHEEERRDIIQKNYQLVKSRYTMDKKCGDLIQWLNQ